MCDITKVPVMLRVREFIFKVMLNLIVIISCVQHQYDGEKFSDILEMRKCRKIISVVHCWG